MALLALSSLYQSFGQFSQIYKTKFLAQTLISQPKVSAKLSCLFTPDNLNSKFSAIYIYMTIILDVLD